MYLPSSCGWQKAFALLVLHAHHAFAQQNCAAPAEYSDLSRFSSGQQVPKSYSRMDSFDNVTVSNLMIACKQGCDFYGNVCVAVIGSLEHNQSGATVGKCYFYQSMPDLAGTYCDYTCPTGNFGYQKDSSPYQSDTYSLTSLLTTLSSEVVDTTAATSDISTDQSSSSSTDMETTSTSTYGPPYMNTTTSSTSSVETTTTSTSITSTISTCNNVPTMSAQQQQCTPGYVYVNNQLFWVQCDHYVYGNVDTYLEGVTLINCLDQCSQNPQCQATRYDANTDTCGIFNSKPDSAEPATLTSFTYAQIESNCPSDLNSPESSEPKQVYNPPTCGEASYDVPAVCQPGVYNAYGKLYEIVCSQQLGGPNQPFNNLGATGTNGVTNVRDLLQACSNQDTCHAINFQVTDIQGTGVSQSNPGTPFAIVGDNSQDFGYAMVQATCDETTLAGCANVPELNTQQNSCTEGQFYVNERVFTTSCSHWNYGNIFDFRFDTNMASCLALCAGYVDNLCQAVRFNNIWNTCGLYQYIPQERAAIPGGLQYGFAQMEPSCQFSKPLPLYNPSSASCTAAAKDLPSLCTTGLYRIDTRLYQVNCGQLSAAFLENKMYGGTVQDCIERCNQDDDCHAANYQLLDGNVPQCQYGTEPGIGFFTGASQAAHAVLVGTCNPCVPYGITCQGDSDCCGDGVCPSGTCQPPCAALGQACSAGSPCCPPNTCQGGICQVPCGAVGDSCTLQPCCSPNTCNELGICQAPCGKTGNSCSEPTDCCSGSCSGDNVCLSCAATNYACQTNEDCCFGNSCSAQGKCTPCGVEYDGCQADSDCCSGSKCFHGSCKPEDYCVPADASCVDSSDCCGNSKCFFGQCKDIEYCSGPQGQCAVAGDCCSGFCGISGFCDLP